MTSPRRQCAKCPRKRSTNPDEIPGGYSRKRHAALKCTIAEPGTARGMIDGGLQMMACHETPVGREQPCVGWLANQLGSGNNLALRLRVLTGRVDGNVELDGEQHETLEQTMARHRKRAS